MYQTTFRNRSRLAELEFGSESAKKVIETLITEKINFHKINHLREWVGNNKVSIKETEQKIEILNSLKSELFQKLKSGKASRVKLVIETE